MAIFGLILAWSSWNDAELYLSGVVSLYLVVAVVTFVVQLVAAARRAIDAAAVARTGAAR